MSDNLKGFVFVDNAKAQAKVKTLLRAGAVNTQNVEVAVLSPRKAEAVKKMSATSRTVVFTASPEAAKAFEGTVAIVIGYVPAAQGHNRAELDKLINVGVVDAFFEGNPMIEKKLKEGVEAINYLCDFQGNSTKGLEKGYTIMQRKMEEAVLAGHSGGMGARV